VFSESFKHCFNGAAVQQAGMVSAVQLRDLRDEFPIGLVRRRVLVRTLLDDPVPAETLRAVSTTPGKARCSGHHGARVAVVQLCSVDVCLHRRWTTNSCMPGAPPHTQLKG